MKKPFKAPIPVHHDHLGMFNTGSGAEINLLGPTEEAINIDDIGHALSNLCRFGGHCFPFYSVAQHSCLVAALAPDSLKLPALLHDAPEAYLGDVIKPLKNLLGHHYTQFEALFEVVIGNKFGIDHHDLKAIKPFDKLALEIEHEALILGNVTRLVETMDVYGLLTDNWKWSPEYAEHQFLVMFQEYYKPELNPMPLLIETT